ncbi:hypothetical protein FBY28_2892 [Arthrobacter sp. SLBN-53]|nr:hypothetical protein FBY28_2892 [Arthrobacter sp. SLBN-53]
MPRRNNGVQMLTARRHHGRRCQPIGIISRDSDAADGVD